MENTESSRSPSLGWSPQFLHPILEDSQPSAPSPKSSLLPRTLWTLSGPLPNVRVLNHPASCFSFSLKMAAVYGAPVTHQAHSEYYMGPDYFDPHHNPEIRAIIISSLQARKLRLWELSLPRLIPLSLYAVVKPRQDLWLWLWS